MPFSLSNTELKKESDRLSALYSYRILDTPPEQDFEEIIALAAQIVNVPIALISLVDRDRQWFKANIGLNVSETARNISFCTLAIKGTGIFEIRDATQDDRVQNSPLVTSEPHLRFYAGMPLITSDGQGIGTLCTMDRVPRELTEAQRKALEILGRQVMARLELRRILRQREARDSDRMALQELSNMLHSCLKMEEAAKVVMRCVGKLMPKHSGAVYLLEKSRANLGLMTKWGERAQEYLPVIGRDSCWGIRRGRTHISSTDPDDVACPHLTSAGPLDSICLPMVAQGEALGLISIMSNRQLNVTADRTAREWQTWLSETIADTLAVALAGLRLREALRENSIRDPLTNLFNRRYMEETLDRELYRVQRAKLPLSVLMLDLDHFKRFNDTHGHEAGDSILKALGEVLQGMFRQDDVVCRWGGEEFVVILPTADASIAMHRAEQLRERVCRMQVAYGASLLPQTTLSIGIAVFPDHADNSAALLRNADIALYAAKNKGRNQVALADGRQVSRDSGDRRLRR
jgi:diguanylate cyclase (GGDEF)-like protein